MRRIDSDTAAINLFGDGKNGFKEGDPTKGIPATKLNKDWFNAAQEELANIIEGFGNGNLDSDNNHQISDLLTAKLGDLGKGSPLVNGYVILPGGITLQWGTAKFGPYTTTRPDDYASIFFGTEFKKQCLHLFVVPTPPDTANDSIQKDCQVWPVPRGYGVKSARVGFRSDYFDATRNLYTQYVAFNWFAVGI